MTPGERLAEAQISDPRFRARVQATAAALDEDTYRDAVLVAGIWLDEAPPGSKDDKCQQCGDPIVLGPTQQRMIGEMEGEKVRWLCHVCVVAVMWRFGDEADVTVTAAGGGGGDGR